MNVIRYTKNQMLKSYFITAFRNLSRHRAFTFINVLGLGVGMTACLLILQYVRYEWNYDKVSPHTPQLWRAFNQTVTNGEVTTQDGNTHSILAPSLKADLPEVTDYFRLYNRNSGEIVFFQNNQPIKIRHAWMADPGFLRLFPQRFIAGDSSACLREPWKMVLTETAARQLFADGDAMGKMLRVPGGPFSGEYMVEGIVADPPQHSHLKFNVLTGYATRYAKDHRDGWDSYWDYSYFQLSPDADPAKVQRQLDKYTAEHLRKEGISLAMQRFEDIHLQSHLTYEIEPNGSARTVRFLGLVALFILAIAFINYVNMTTARSLERAKEVGLRKTIGAKRIQLIGQFLFEGVILNAMSLLLAIILLKPLLPVFGRLIGRPLAEQGFDLIFWSYVAILFLTGMLAACGYPAIALSRFTPLQAMRGTENFLFRSSGNNSNWLRKILVVFQFGCSAILIFGLLVIGKQLLFLQNHDKGLSLNQMLAIKTPDTDWRQDSLNRLRMGAFKNDIAQISGIKSYTTSGIVPGLGISSISGSSGGLVLADKPGQPLPGTIYFIDAEPGFYDTYGIKFLAGRPYHAPDRSVGERHVIINNAMLRQLGISSPADAVGKELAYAGNTDGYRMKIEGVVADFHIESLKEPARATLYFCLPEVGNGFVSLKLESENAGRIISSLEQAWKKIFPESPFEYWFLSEQFAQQYTAETQLSKVFGLFSGLAIFIACLGLYGMATYAATRRKKEIGIRKVLGASVTGIVKLLSKEYILLVVLAIVIASPLAWLAMNKWLQGFAYRINIDWWMFVLTGLAALLIALLSLSFQAIKAAMDNPVKSLRTE